jgi:uncharacterized protein
MNKMTGVIFYNDKQNLKGIWWVVTFFLMLFAILFPLILLSQHYGFEITLWHQVLIIGGVSIICQALRRKPQQELVGRINTHWLVQLGVGMGIGALIMILPAFILFAFGIVRWQSTDLSIEASASATFVVLSAVIAEELLFRGFIFQRLITAFGAWPAQLIIAGMFLLTHLNNPGMTGTAKVFSSINIFVASILFGLAYTTTRKLAMPIGIHFMANYVQGIILGFGVSGNQHIGFLQPIFLNHKEWLTGGNFGLEASAPGLLCIGAISLSFYLYSRGTFTSNKSNEISLS